MYVIVTPEREETTFFSEKELGKKHLYYNQKILFYTARNSRNSPSPAGFRKEDSTEEHRPIFTSNHPTPRASPWSSITSRDAGSTPHTLLS